MSISSTTGLIQLSCPKCGERGKTVKHVTLRSLLKPECQQLVGAESYRFCPNLICDTVYFPEDEGRLFRKSDLTVRVGAKETDSPRLICYCFDYTYEEIEHDVAEMGTSQIPDSITRKCREGLDRCEETNPRGSCCLGDVRRALRKAQTKFRNHSEVEVVAVVDKIEGLSDICANETDSKESAEKGSMNAGCWATVGTLFAAVLSSACCWLPLLLISVGVSGVAISSTLEQYRPLFATITFAFLGAAFYFTYRPNLRALVGIRSSDAESCCAEAPQEEGCCTTKSGSKPFSTQKFNKAMLWVVTVLAMAFVLFPNYVGTLLAGSGSISENPKLQKVVFHIEGMSCEGCAVTVRKAISNVPSVSEVEVSYEKGEAIVGVPAERVIPYEMIQKAVSDAGYEARIASIGSQP